MGDTCLALAILITIIGAILLHCIEYTGHEESKIILDATLEEGFLELVGKLRAVDLRGRPRLDHDVAVRFLVGAERDGRLAARD